MNQFIRFTLVAATAAALANCTTYIEDPTPDATRTTTTTTTADSAFIPGGSVTTEETTTTTYR